MTKTQAEAICALLSAAFPRDPMPDSTVAMWSDALLDGEFSVADEAVRDLMLAMDRMPSLREVIDAIAETRRAWMTRTNRPVTFSLPPGVEAVSFAAWYEDYATDEQRATADRVFPVSVREALERAS